MGLKIIIIYFACLITQLLIYILLYTIISNYDQNIVESLSETPHQSTIKFKNQTIFQQRLTICNGQITVKLRFIDLDAKYLNQIPFIFQPIKPLIYGCKQTIVRVNDFVGLPWWAVLVMTSLTVRLIIFPLILVQMKRFSKLGPVSPIFVHIKDMWKHSNLPFKQRLKLVYSAYKDISKNQGFKLRNIFIYNLAYYPILISMIYAIRQLLSDPVTSSATFLHIQNFADIDPYFILPTITIGLYYWNFQRFITAENKYTLMSRIRAGCQILLIIWYPFLCCWPSGIVIYMCSNAIISVIQTTITKSPWFISKISQKITFYNYVLSTVEYDKGTSDAIIYAIKSGEQATKDKAIKQPVLVQQTQQMIANLQLEKLQQQEQIKQEK